MTKFSWFVRGRAGIGIKMSVSRSCSLNCYFILAHEGGERKRKEKVVYRMSPGLVIRICGRLPGQLSLTQSLLLRDTSQSWVSLEAQCTVRSCLWTSAQDFEICSPFSSSIVFIDQIAKFFQDPWAPNPKSCLWVETG